MKKIWKSLIILTLGAFTFNSCEDVPEPYPYPSVNGETPSTEGVYINESFAKTLGSFENKQAEGNLEWSIAYSSATITGFKDFNNDGAKENQPGVTYLVSQPVDLTASTGACISFDHAINYSRTSIVEDHKLLICKDYNGDVTTATWEEIPFNTDNTGSSFTFVPVAVDVPAAYIGQPNVVIAFKHTAHNDYSSTWEVKNLKMKEGSATTQPTEPEGDFIYKETVGTLTLSDNPYVDAYTGWAKAGSGAANVTYSGSKTSVRKSGLANTDAYENASGPNVVFFGVAPSYFIVNKIALTSEQTKLKLTFGASYSAKDESTGKYDNTFDISKFTVSLSADGSTWTPITYTKNNGDATSPYWISANADFTLKNAVTALYIKFEASVSSAIRLDDITLSTGNGGQEITLEENVTPPTEESTPITIGELINKMTSEGAVIDAAANRSFEAVVQSNVPGGNYTNNNLCVAEENATSAKQGIILYGSQVDPKTLGLTQGDKVRITLMAGLAKALNYKGMLEVTGDKTANWCKVEKIGIASITPVVLNASALSNLIDYQGMTVKVDNASTTDNTTWGSGTHTFTANGVNFTIYANNSCTFANNTIDNTKTGSITGVVTVYSGNAQIAPRTDADITAFNGGSNPGGGDTPGTGDLVMTSDDFINNTLGDVPVTTNNYGSQSVSNEVTWYRWTANGIEYRGARICQAPENNGGGIQIQGNATDNAKQGFFTNVTAVSNIKKIAITMRTIANSKYDPSFSLYAGTSALPTTNAITPSTSKTTGSSFNTYVYTYDLSGNNYSYFTIKNDLVGAVYIDKIEIYNK